MREIRDREFPAAGGEQVYHFLQSTEKQTENERKYYEKILEKKPVLFLWQQLLQPDLQAAVRLTITIQLQQLQAKSAAESKVNGENSPEADNKKQM